MGLFPDWYQEKHAIRKLVLCPLFYSLSLVNLHRNYWFSTIYSKRLTVVWHESGRIQLSFKYSKKENDSIQTRAL